MCQVKGDILYSVLFDIIPAANNIALGDAFFVLGAESIKGCVRLRGGGLDFHGAAFVLPGQQEINFIRMVGGIGWERVVKKIVSVGAEGLGDDVFAQIAEIGGKLFIDDIICKGASLKGKRNEKSGIRKIQLEIVNVLTQ